MKRRRFLCMAGMLFVASFVTRRSAAASSDLPLVGLLDAGDREAWWDAFRQRLSELGYVAGRSARFEVRYAKGDLDALPALARELVKSKPSVIVTSGAAAAVAAQRATRKIPIVMASGTDQVSLGLAESLAHPGSNVTGVSSLTSDLMVKRFELLRELVPLSTRVGALWHADNAPSMSSVRDLDEAAAKARVAFRSFGVRSAEELRDTFSGMKRERIEALVVVNSPFIYEARKAIVALALDRRIPAIYGAAEYADAGGLISYAPSYPEMFRHAAVYVDKILRGANPGDIPIEQPTTFEFVINAGTARKIGVAIPGALLARADRVIP